VVRRIRRGPSTRPDGGLLAMATQAVNTPALSQIDAELAGLIEAEKLLGKAEFDAVCGPSYAYNKVLHARKHVNDRIAAHFEGEE